MHVTPEQNDAATVAVIRRNPGIKRNSPWITKAATVRLINAHIVAQPSTSGRLYLVEHVNAAREWARDCEWLDDIDLLSDSQVASGLAKHYEGGWAGFIADGAPTSL
jgi:hypothetical protein